MTSKTKARPSLALTVAAVVALLLQTVSLAQSKEGPTEWKEYYPLAVGYTWRYALSSPERHQNETIVWKVVNRASNEKGEVFAVWPTPADTDDEGMQLQVTSAGLVEVDHNFYLLQFPVTKARQWTAGASRRFYVVSEGEPCVSGKLSFKRCAIVRDDDQELHLRTLTTYAYGIGPVKYEYFKMNSGGTESQPTQMLTILSYSFKQSTSDSRTNHGGRKPSTE